MKFDYKDLLFVVCGHQNTEEKKEVLIENLKNLKSEGFKVCYSTHCGDYLDEISQHCDYISYDNNNDFVYDGDIIKNLKYISEDDIKSFIKNRDNYYKYSAFDGNKQARSYMHDTFHTKPALTLFRSGSKIAIQNGFKWISYLEYDIQYPKNGYMNMLKDIYSKIRDTEYKSYFFNRNYEWVDLDPYIWTGFFVTHISNLSHEFLYEDWCSSRDEFIKTFGVRYYERIISDKVLDVNKCYIDDLSKRLFQYWGDNELLNINKFISIYSNEQIHKQFNFYISKEEGEFHVNIFSYLSPNSLISEFDINDIKLYINDKVIEIGDIHIYQENFWIYRIGKVGKDTEYKLEFYLNDILYESIFFSTDVEKLYLLKSIVNI